MKHIVFTLALCLPVVAAANDATERLRRAFPGATVRTYPETDPTFDAAISFPPAEDGARAAANAVPGDPEKIAADFLEAHSEAIGLQAGKCGVERVDDTARPVVVRLYDRIGKARVAGSHYIVHVQDGRVSYAGITTPRARVSHDLRKRAERITELEPLKAWDVVFADITRRTGKDPRTGFWWQEGVRAVEMDQLPADLIVIPDEELLVYEVKFPGHIFWVDAETFELRKPKSPR